MRLIVTGGGTGGHVFPALEVARFAKSKQVHVAYFGSNRGQENQACQTEKIPFVGFDSHPVYSLKTLKGWAAMAKLVKARSAALKELGSISADVVFSTGGYSSAPVASAARAAGIPVVVHEQNSVPGRTNLHIGRGAFSVATTFHSTAPYFAGCNVVRTGLPVRAELRRAAESRVIDELVPTILVVGGSQGAMAINEAALGAAQRMVNRDLHWIHVTGPKNFQECYPSYERLGLKDTYQMHAFLGAAEMAAAYSRATVVVGRSGASTLAELAAFRLPSVVTPYPHAFADHQVHNAKEFAEMGAALILNQSDLMPAELDKQIQFWLGDVERREQAAKALGLWDAPDAAERIFELIQFAADSKKK